MQEPVLDQIYEYCRYYAPRIDQEIELSFDGVLCALLYEGLVAYLPELLQWQDLDADMVRLKRVDLVNFLVEYAGKRHLDENWAFNTAGMIARNIDKENVSAIVQELGVLENSKEQSVI